jgi:hypothetical protein
MFQSDLFYDYKPQAHVIPFPTERRVSLVHSIAQRLDALDYESGKSFWQTVCRDVRNGLRKNGLTTAEIRTSIDQFAEDVHRELKIVRIQKQYRPEAAIFALTGERIQSLPHGHGAGEACALGQGAKLLAGLGGAHESMEHDAARAREGGAA